MGKMGKTEEQKTEMENRWTCGIDVLPLNLCPQHDPWAHLIGNAAI